MGLTGLTEGAIPFAAADPVRVIPSIMVGSAVAAVIAMVGKVGDHAPHGGPIVLFAVDHSLAYLLAILSRNDRHRNFNQSAESTKPAVDGYDGGKSCMKIVAVTACPTGIAHTYMAAARLEKVGKDSRLMKSKLRRRAPWASKTN